MSCFRLVDWSTALICAAALGFASVAEGATIIVGGTVRDASTGAAISGVDITIRRGGTDLGAAVSGTDGTFQLPFEIESRPEAQHLTVLARKDAFDSGSRTIVVTAGKATPRSFDFELVPAFVAECRRSVDHTLVVGYFRPAAASAGDPDIASRVADALNFDLLVRMQQQLAATALPSIIACGGARPRAVADYQRFAKVLDSDAFLVGWVDNAALSKVKLEMAVIDGYGVLAAPLRASGGEVNLNDPALARLKPEAHAAILTALVNGYEKAGKFAECVEFTSAAARIIGTLPQPLQEVRSRCEQRVPNRGLLPGGSP